MYCVLYLPDQFFLRDRARHLVLRLVGVHLGESGGGADLKRILVIHLRKNTFEQQLSKVEWMIGNWTLEAGWGSFLVCPNLPICSTEPFKFSPIARL